MKKILVIDDDAAWLELIGRYLARAGHAVIFATNGVDGQMEARRTRPDLVLCDLGMPKMNGYEVVKACRATPELMNMLIIACTVGLVDTETMVLAVGFDGVLLKNADDREIVKTVNRFMDGKQIGATATDHPGG